MTIKIKMLAIVCVLSTFALTLFSLQPPAKKAILVVSFGTTHQDALARAIEPIEKKMAARFSDCETKRAFTSEIVRKRLAKKGIHIPSPAQALKELAAKGIKDVYVQPLHIIPGFEYHELVKTVQHHTGNFATLRLGTPLLNHPGDFTHVARILSETFTRQNRSKKASCTILMGHGTHHPANACYALLQTELSRLNPDIFLATVEGSLSLQHLFAKLPSPKGSSVVLAPFMLVAGDHAKNDLAGDEDDSWKSILRHKGFQVHTQLKGLGEEPGFQDIFVEKLEKLMNPTK